MLVSSASQRLDIRPQRRGDLHLHYQPTVDVGPNQLQPQTQYNRCQFPTNHQNYLKQLFLELISESKKTALLRANSESLLMITSGVLTILLRRYHETTTRQPTRLAANLLHLFHHQQVADTSITKQQIPASPNCKHLYFLLQLSRSCKNTLVHEREFCLVLTLCDHIDIPRLTKD